MAKKGTTWQVWIILERIDDEATTKNAEEAFVDEVVHAATELTTDHKAALAAYENIRHYSEGLVP